MDLDKIKELAMQEIQDEDLRAAVDRMKEKLRRRKWYHVLFPYKIVLIRRSM